MCKAHGSICLLVA